MQQIDLVNIGNQKLYLPVKNKTNKYVERKGKKVKKERIDMQRQIEVDEEDLCTLKFNSKGERTVGKQTKE